MKMGKKGQKKGRIRADRMNNRILVNKWGCGSRLTTALSIPKIQNKKKKMTEEKNNS